jgi:hypothetical protein
MTINLNDILEEYDRHVISYAKKINKKDYEDRKNFWSALMKYQCKQPTRFPQEELFRSLDDYFRRKNILPREEIKKHLNCNIEFTGVETGQSFYFNANAKIE